MLEGDILLRPPLTTIRVPKIELGAEALKLLVNTIKNKKIVIKKKILVPVELIISGSTSFCKSK